MKIEFNEEERRALLALIDLAVKAAGLQVAEAATVLAAKISKASDQPAAEQAAE